MTIGPYFILPLNHAIGVFGDPGSLIAMRINIQESIGKAVEDSYYSIDANFNPIKLVDVEMFKLPHRCIKVEIFEGAYAHVKRLCQFTFDMVSGECILLQGEPDNAKEEESEGLGEDPYDMS